MTLSLSENGIWLMYFIRLDVVMILIAALSCSHANGWTHILCAKALSMGI